MNNKKITLLVLIAISLASFSACNEYKSFSQASKISQLSGNPFMYNLSKSLLTNIKGILAITGNKADIKGVNLLTPINSFLKTQEQINSVKNLLNTTYKVPVKAMEAKWGTIGTVKDLVGFVAKNGRQFRF